MERKSSNASLNRQRALLKTPSFPMTLPATPKTTARTVVPNAVKGGWINNWAWPQGRALDEVISAPDLSKLKKIILQGKRGWGGPFSLACPPWFCFSLGETRFDSQDAENKRSLSLLLLLYAWLMQPLSLSPPLLHADTPTPQPSHYLTRLSCPDQRLSVAHLNSGWSNWTGGQMNNIFDLLDQFVIFSKS